MDNLFGNYIEGLIFLFGACAIACALLIPLASIADWLQKKLDEFYNDNEQLNNAEQ